MVAYIHERQDWPNFRWSSERLALSLAGVRHEQGRLIGRMESLGFEPRQATALQTLTEDVLRTSEIEGEILDRQQVRSSLARRLGIDIGALAPSDRNVDGVVEMTLDAIRHYSEPLTEARLFAWHASLFPDGRSGMRRIRAGTWRNDASGPMQVVSGPPDREKVHYQAPAAASLHDEMSTFLDWFNRDTDIDPVLKAGLSHLWFVTIHPFDDGNGRVARAIADMVLARSEAASQRFYSMSTQIRVQRKAYYDVLETTQKGDLDVTEWLAWFLACLGRAIGEANGQLGGVLAKARFWEAHADGPFNQRQRGMLNRLHEGFEGKLTSSKWAKLMKCSQDTAHRDITDLVERGILAREAGGRSTSYVLTAP